MIDKITEDVIIDESCQLQLKECHLICYDVAPGDFEFITLGVKEYAFILHDNDFENDGSLKKPHYHVYLKLHKKKDINVIAKVFNIKSNLVERVKSLGCLIRYFIHLDNPNKYQYESYEINSNFDIFQYLEFSISDNNFVLNCMNKIRNKDIKKFNDLVNYALSCNKLDFVSRRAYFFKCLLND